MLETILMFIFWFLLSFSAIYVIREILRIAKVFVTREGVVTYSNRELYCIMAALAYILATILV